MAVADFQRELVSAKIHLLQFETRFKVVKQPKLGVKDHQEFLFPVISISSFDMLKKKSSVQCSLGEVKMSMITVELQIKMNVDLFIMETLTAKAEKI